MRDHGEHLPDGLYRTLMHALADDFEAGGVVAEICRDWVDASPAAVVQLRLLAGLQRLVLAGDEPGLARYYPNLGGTADPDQAWAEVEPVLRRHADQLRAELAIAPQTNEPGRSVALLVGLFDAVRRSGLRSVRLLELGASAGLNLLVDRYCYSGDGWSYGPTESPLRFDDAVVGSVQPDEFEVIERRGCDLAPIDASSVDGRLRLTSFVWPHHLHRHERLRAALAVAESCPVVVDAESAASWLPAMLEAPVGDGMLTVVWHSVTRQYWPAEEVAAVSAIIAAASERMPIAHISMENPVIGSTQWEFRPAELTVQLAADERPVTLGTVADHGVPVTMTAIASTTSAQS